MPIRIKLFMLVITSLSLFGFKVFHPFYLGICHFKHNVPENTLDASIKLFVNDFEEALRKTNKKQVDLINGVNKKEINQFIENYIKTNLQLKINQQNIGATYLGFEIEKEIIWIYLEYKSINQIKSFEMTNTLLYDYFPGQTHIIRLDCNNTERSFKITNPEKSVREVY